MRKWLYILFLIFFCTCKVADTSKEAQINFSRANHDFGSLSYQNEASYSFQFKNPGKTPLVIFDVKTSCGCTVPEWTKKPVKPNDSGEIKIKYEAAFPGMFHKEISVYFNGKDSPVKLTIKGQVEYPVDMEEATE